jgi:hypothetical protein
MVYSGAVPPYDTTRTNVAFRLAQQWNYWTNAPSDSRADLTKGDIAASTPPGTVHASGLLHAQQYQAGSDDEGLIGQIPTAQALHLYIMGDVAQSLQTRLQAAELAMDANYPQAYWPTHYREGDASRKYLSIYEEPAQTTPAFGKPVSLDGRPSLTTNLPQTSWTAPADRVTIVGPVRKFNSNYGQETDALTIGVDPTSCACNENSVFTDNKAHSWMPIFQSYMLLGDWYAMEELQYWASWYLTNADPSMSGAFPPGDGRDSYGRHGSWGLGTDPNNGRAMAWHTRAIGYAYVSTPTEDDAFAPMRKYLLSKLRLNYLTMEGLMDVRTGLYQRLYPSFKSWNCSGWDNNAMTLPGHASDDPYTAWSWGRCNQGLNKPNPLHFRGWGNGTPPVFIDPAKTGLAGDFWHEMYQDHVAEYLSRLGVADAGTFAAAALRPLWIDGVKPGGGFLMSAYTSPLGGPDLNLFTSWSQVANAFQPGFSDMVQWCAGNSLSTPPWCNDFPYLVHHSYQHLFRAAIALGESGTGNGGFSGTSAWDWILGNAVSQDLYGTAGQNDGHVDPRYAWTPQFIRNVQVQPGTTQAVIRWASFSADSCKVGVSRGFAGSDDAEDVVVNPSGRFGWQVVSNLTPSSTYAYRITCGPSGGTVRVAGNFTTAAAGTTAALRMQLAPPASLGAARAVLDYGATAALGASTASTACAGACTISVPVTTGSALYYRVRYLDNSGNALPAGGGVQAIVP